MTTVEYTLSFENYLEMTQSRREKKDFRFAAVSAITGFFCIAGGYLFLKLGSESFFPGGLLLATGLLLTFLAIILGFLTKEKPSRPNTKVLRREYELHHADRRILEFDGNGWRVQWREGEDFRPWSCLRQIYDLETLLVLATETTFYWFPKEALQRDGPLENLQSLAESFLARRDLLFEVELRPSPQVYVGARIVHNWRLYLLPRLLFFAALTLITYWIFSNEGDAGSTDLWIPAAIPLGLVLCEVLFYLVRYFKEDWSKSSRNAEVMSDSIGYRTKKVRWIVEHKHITDLREIPGAFMVYFEPGAYHLIPKRNLLAGQIAQFREVVANNRLQIPQD